MSVFCIACMSDLCYNAPTGGWNGQPQSGAKQCKRTHRHVRSEQTAAAAPYARSVLPKAAHSASHADRLLRDARNISTLDMTVEPPKIVPKRSDCSGSNSSEMGLSTGQPKLLSKPKRSVTASMPPRLLTMTWQQTQHIKL